MKETYTEIIVVLDESGSMFSVITDTIGGFNQFLKEQKEVPGDAKLTLIKFDTTFEFMYKGIDINDVEDLNMDTYKPGGGTALFDAMGKGIVETRDRIDEMKDEEKPSNVIFVTLTDGEENSSKEYLSYDPIKKMIEYQTKKNGWEFVFIGANQDAFETASHFGISRGATMTYAASSLGTQAAFTSMSKGLMKRRVGDKETNYFDDEDYKSQDDLLNKDTDTK